MNAFAVRRRKVDPSNAAHFGYPRAGFCFLSFAVHACRVHAKYEIPNADVFTADEDES